MLSRGQARLGSPARICDKPLWASRFAFFIYGCGRLFEGSLSLASTIGSVVLAASIYLAAAVTGFSIQFANTPLGRLLEIAAAFGISWVVVIAYRLVWALFALGTRQLREIDSLKAQVSEKVSKPNTLADAIQKSPTRSGNLTIRPHSCRTVSGVSSFRSRSQTWGTVSSRSARLGKVNIHRS